MCATSVIKCNGQIDVEHTQLGIIIATLLIHQMVDDALLIGPYQYTVQTDSISS